MMAIGPLPDMLGHEIWIIRNMRQGDLAAFIADIERDGWDVARNTLVRYSRIQVEPEEPKTEGTQEWR